MSKAVLLSIKPEWCALIASGEKTIEVRKTRPKLDPPFKEYIYCTKEKTKGQKLFCSKWRGTVEAPAICFNKVNGKVIGEFTCKKIDKLVHTGWDRNNQHLEILNPENNRYEFVDGKWLAKTVLTYQEVDDYSKGGDIYGNHISDLVIYDEPKELSEFKKPCPAEACENCEYYHAIYYNELPVCNYEHLLKRQPQSWCYVEDKNE